MTEEYYREVAKGLLELPAVLEDVLGVGDRIADLSKIFTYAHNFIYLGAATTTLRRSRGRSN